MAVIIMVIVWKEVSNGNIIFRSTFINKFIKPSLVIAFIFYFIISNFVNAELAVKKFSIKNNQSITKKYISEDPSNLNIIAPMTFIFNEIKSFNRIHGEICYVEFQKADPTVKGNGFFKKARSFDISYIILTPFYRNLLGLEHMNGITDTYGYKVLQNNELLILKYSPE